MIPVAPECRGTVGYDWPSPSIWSFIKFVQIQDKACYRGGTYVDSHCLNHTSCFSPAVVRLWGHVSAGLSSRGLKHPALGHGADWWAKVLVSMKVKRISNGSLPFVALACPA
jgi:hypothetical protein